MKKIVKDPQCGIPRPTPGTHFSNKINTFLKLNFIEKKKFALKNFKYNWSQLIYEKNHHNSQCFKNIF